MSTLMTRLLADTRRARHLRQARAEIRRAERAVARRMRAANPGYDELSDSLFLSVMVLAVIVLCADLHGEAGASVLIEWFHAAVAALKGLA